MDEIKILLNELCSLNYCQGRHSGIWDSVEDREAYSFRYLEKMMEHAREHDVPFKENIKDNFFESDWKYHENNGIEYAYDELGYELKEQVENKIIQKILNAIEYEEPI